MNREGCYVQETRDKVSLQKLAEVAHTMPQYTKYLPLCELAGETPKLVLDGRYSPRQCEATTWSTEIELSVDLHIANVAPARCARHFADKLVNSKRIWCTTISPVFQASENDITTTKGLLLSLCVRDAVGRARRLRY